MRPRRKDYRREAADAAKVAADLQAVADAAHAALFDAKQAAAQADARAHHAHLAAANAQKQADDAAAAFGAVR